MSFEVGDWVRSYSAGIWQVYRILNYKCLDPVTGEERDKTTIFSKRFVTNSFKRSFKEECCEPAIVQHLDSGEQGELEVFISQNTQLYEKFLGFEPKNIDCIYNARIGIPKSGDSSVIAEAFTRSKPMRDLDINQYLTGMGYDTKGMPSWTVQFLSENFEIENGYLIFKFSRILEH